MLFGGSLFLFAGGCSLHLLMDAGEYFQLVFVVVLFVGIVPAFAGAAIMWSAFWRG